MMEMLKYVIYGFIGICIAVMLVIIVLALKELIHGNPRKPW